MMKLLVTVIFLVLIISPCIAAQDSIITGPYRVSFDLGAYRNQYTVHADDNYNIDINTSNGTRLAVISIIELSVLGAEKISASSLKEQIQSMLDEYSGHREITKGNIDGVEGAVGVVTSDGSSLCLALYQPDFDIYHLILINSQLPLNSTRQLLDTIHVQKTTS